MRRASLILETRRIDDEINALQVEGVLLEAMQNEIVSSLIIAEQRKLIRYAASLGMINRNKINEGTIADIAIGLGSMLPLGIGNVVGAAGVVWYIKEMFKAPVASFQFFMNLIMALLSSVAAADPTGIGAMGGISNAPKLLLPFIKLGNAVKGVGTAIKGTRAAQAFINSIKIPGAEEIMHFIASPRVAGTIESLLETLTSKSQAMFELIKSPRTAEIIGKIPGAGSLWPRFVGVVESYGARAIQMVTDNIKSIIDLAKAAFQESAAAAAEYGAEASFDMVAGPTSQQINKATASGLGKQFVARGANKRLAWQHPAVY